MAEWRNRIIGEAEIDPTCIEMNPNNWRFHSSFQEDVLISILQDVGWVQRVIVNKRTGHLIDGHLRVKAAVSKQSPTIPVLYVDLNDEEEKLLLASLDPIAALAVTDKEKLSLLLHEIQSGDAILQTFFTQLAENEGLIEAQTDDAFEHWQGMPEFESEPLAFRTLQVHFKTLKDFQGFAHLIDRVIGDKTKTLWFPEQERRELKNFRYETNP